LCRGKSRGKRMKKDIFQRGTEKKKDKKGGNLIKNIQ